MLIVKRWDAADGALQLSALRRELQREGLNTAWWSEVPGVHVEEHQHPFPEARWVLSGYLRVYVGDEVIDLGPGERLDLPPGDVRGAPSFLGCQISQLENSTPSATGRSAYPSRCMRRSVQRT